MAIWHEEYELYRKYVHNISRLYKQQGQLQAYMEMGLSLAAIIIFLTFAIRPTVVTISGKISEIQKKEVIVAQLTQKIDALSMANSILQSEKAALDLLEVAVPNNPSPEEYIAQVDALTRRNNTIMDGMILEDTPVLGTQNNIPEELTENPEEIETTGTGRIAWFPFSVVTLGEYTDLTRFMDSLENLTRPMKINASFIEETLTGELKLTVQGEIPYYTNE